LKNVFAILRDGILDVPMALFHPINETYLREPPQALSNDIRRGREFFFDLNIIE
jgi:hypothetical protein